MQTILLGFSPSCLVMLLERPGDGRVQFFKLRLRAGRDRADLLCDDLFEARIH